MLLQKIEHISAFTFPRSCETSSKNISWWWGIFLLSHALCGLEVLLNKSFILFVVLHKVRIYSIFLLLVVRICTCQKRLIIYGIILHCHLFYKHGFISLHFFNFCTLIHRWSWTLYNFVPCTLRQLWMVFMQSSTWGFWSSRWEQIDSLCCNS